MIHPRSPKTSRLFLGPLGAGGVGDARHPAPAQLLVLVQLSRRFGLGLAFFAVALWREEKRVVVGRGGGGWLNYRELLAGGKHAGFERTSTWYAEAAVLCWMSNDIRAFK